jgi:hypothetical protein
VRSAPELNSDTNYSNYKEQNVGLPEASPRAACCRSSPSLVDYLQRGQTTYHPTRVASSDASRAQPDGAIRILDARDDDLFADSGALALI